MKITLGDPLKKREMSPYDTWPVLRDGTDTGAVVYETEDGYRFNWPGSHKNPMQHIGPERPFREDALEDAEKWLKGRNA